MEMDDQEMEQDTDDHSGHEQEEEGHESHSEVLMEEDLETLVPNYLELREALANDDFEMARQHMDMFSEEDFSDIRRSARGIQSDLRNADRAGRGRRLRRRIIQTILPDV